MKRSKIHLSKKDAVVAVLLHWRRPACTSMQFQLIVFTPIQLCNFSLLSKPKLGLKKLEISSFGGGRVSDSAGLFFPVLWKWPCSTRNALKRSIFIFLAVLVNFLSTFYFPDFGGEGEPEKLEFSRPSLSNFSFNVYTLHSIF